MTTTDPNGNVTRYAYDGADRLASVMDPVGRVATFGYDALGRPASVSNAAIQSAPLVQRAYTPDGLTASLTIARANTTFNVTNLAYDGLDRLATTTYPGGSTETLAYDADSNVLTRKTRKGDTITFTYDTLNRLPTKAEPSEPTVTYSYHLAGRLIGASDTSAAISAAAWPAGSVATASMSLDQLNRPLGFTFGPAPAQDHPHRRHQRLCLHLRPHQPAHWGDHHRQFVVGLSGRHGERSELYGEQPRPVHGGGCRDADL